MARGVSQAPYGFPTPLIAVRIPLYAMGESSPIDPPKSCSVKSSVRGTQDEFSNFPPLLFQGPAGSLTICAAGRHKTGDALHSISAKASAKHLSDVRPWRDFNSFQETVGPPTISEELQSIVRQQCVQYYSHNRQMCLRPLSCRFDCSWDGRIFFNIDFVTPRLRQCR